MAKTLKIHLPHGTAHDAATAEWDAANVKPEFEPRGTAHDGAIVVKHGGHNRRVALRANDTGDLFLHLEE